MKTRPRWRAALRRCLLRDGDAEETLRQLIRQLDLPRDPPPTGLPAIALAHAVLATGPALLAAGCYGPEHPVRATLRAAAAFVAAPSEATWSPYFAAATNSFPFGPGDGCHSILPPERHAEPGSGCRTGAGTLLAIAHAVSAPQVLADVRTALLPWLDHLDSVYP